MYNFWSCLPVIQISAGEIVLVIVSLIGIWITARNSNRTLTLTRKLFEAEHRPYVGDVTDKLYMEDDFDVKLINFGSAGAHNVIINTEFSKDGEEYFPIGRYPNKPIDIFPKEDDQRIIIENRFLLGKLAGGHLETHSFFLRIRIKYESSTKEKYDYCKIYQYTPHDKSLNTVSSTFT
jgi:hypothetical protein